MPSGATRFPSCDLRVSPRCEEISHSLRGKRPSQDTLSLLAAQHRRLEEEIALARGRLAEIENQKPGSTMDKRMRRKGLWPETNLESLVFEVSDDEDDESGVGSSSILMEAP